MTFQPREGKQRWVRMQAAFDPRAQPSRDICQFAWVPAVSAGAITYHGNTLFERVEPIVRAVRLLRQRLGIGGYEGE